MRILVSASLRGGSGKTSQTISVATAFAARGLNVLVIDLDQQAHAAEYLDVDVVRGRTIAELLVPPESGELALADLIYPTCIANLWMIPSERSSLMSAEQSLSNAGPSGYESLLEALEPVVGSIDVVIIDTSPTLGFLVDLALVSADGFMPVMPAKPSFYAGVHDLYARADGIRKRMNPELADMGISIIGYGSDEAALQADVLIEKSGRRVLARIATSSLPESSFIAHTPFMVTRPGFAASVSYAAIVESLSKQLGIGLLNPRRLSFVERGARSAFTYKKGTTH